MDSVAGDVLARGARGLVPHLQPSGELFDPLFGEPTQYGTAYYAYVNAALATLEPDGRAERVAAATQGLEATLHHLADPGSHRPATRYYPAVGSPSYANLRDFMWPPVLRTLGLLRALGVDVDRLADQVRAVPVPDVFNKRPPVNWASVWLVGEWLRIRVGLSPYGQEDVDRWLAPFLDEAIDLDRGIYHEPGWPNTYDLFTRVHLLYLLDEGYAGKYAADLRRLLVTGLRRSLAVQLADGSLASAHRSTGQTWTLGAQCSYFHLAAQLIAGEDPEAAAVARDAAARSLGALERSFRPGGALSPVQNVFPASDRIGYEVYTSDPHYVALPLGFLATAVLAGFTGEATPVDESGPRVLVEDAPVHRSVAHADGWSVHLNLNPQDGYVTADQAFDAFGIADVVLGRDRWLRFGGQTRHAGTQTPLTLGLAVHRPDDAIEPLSAMRPSSPPVLAAAGAGLRGSAQLGDLRYEIQVWVDGDVVRVVEGVGEHRISLLVPYLRDRGDGRRTTVTATGRTATFELRGPGSDTGQGGEVVEVVVTGEVERIVHLTHGYESRYGLHGLVRFDLARPGPVRYEIRRTA